MSSVTEGTKIFHLTHVVYEEGDWLGAFLAFTGLFPFVVVVGLIAICWRERELLHHFSLLGLMLCEGLNKVLKRIIREPRPPLSPKGGFGMPSAHSQFAFFLLTFCTLLLLLKWRTKSFESVAQLFGLWVAAFAVCIGRVYLSYHTLSQVLVGVVVGGVLGVVWYWVYCSCNPLFLSMQKWKICQWYHLSYLEELRTQGQSAATTRRKILTELSVKKSK